MLSKRTNLFIFLFFFILERVFAQASFSKVSTELLQAKLSNHNLIFGQDFFVQNFSSPRLLKLDDDIAKSGVEYDGEYTRKTMNRLFRKGISGENINIAVLGGSSTLGADLGIQNKQSTFHYGLKEWWNRIVTPLTGSYMNVTVIAIGGTGTMYMGLCWKDYIRNLNSLDLVLWEFFINDPDCINYLEGVEKLFASIKHHPSQPSFMLVRFFKRNVLQCSPPLSNSICSIKNCPKHAMKSNVLKQQCSTYGFTMLNLLPTICEYLKISKMLNINELFINHHPSHLAHAQMAFILIKYIQDQFQQYLISSANHPISLEAESIFIGNQKKDLNKICWTGVLPNSNFIVPNSIFNLPVKQNYGFKKVKSTNWIPSTAIREDVRGGYSTGFRNTRIIVSLPSPMAMHPYAVYAAISHQQNGGKIQISVKSIATQKNIELDCSRKVTNAMSINQIINNVTGDAEFQMDVLNGNGGCLLNAIILEYDKDKQQQQQR